jgi:hypothetical protein
MQLLAAGQSAETTDWATVYVTLIVGVLAAGGALAGVVISQSAERRKAARDRALQRRTTSATLRASLYAAESASLRTALAEYLNLSYEVTSAHRQAMTSLAPWPGEMWDVVMREDVLYNTVRLLLDESKQTHRDLQRTLDILRSESSDVAWLDRRDAVVAAAGRAMRVDSEEILSLLEAS